MAGERTAPHIIPAGAAALEAHGVLGQRIERLVLGLRVPRRRQDQIAVVRRQPERVEAALVHAEAELPKHLRARVGALLRGSSGIRARRRGQLAEVALRSPEGMVIRRRDVGARFTR